MPLPFEVDFEEVSRSPDIYVDQVFACLESEFLVMPKGVGFIEYPVFENGYEALKRTTGDFRTIDPSKVAECAFETPVALIVLRTILGFTPSEWSYLTTRHTGVEISQGAGRSLDRKIRLAPDRPLPRHPGAVTTERILALVRCACSMLQEGAPAVPQGKIHRLQKADTSLGPAGVQNLSAIGVPYAMLLYERFLGRPFAGHRDSVSELVGDTLETAIEEALHRAGISPRKTRRAEKISGLDPTPDFIVPDEFNPQVVIEAKLTEDDGTARDKVSRIQVLSAESLKGQPPGIPRFEVIACIAGRGFGIRREDMKRLLIATRGKVFTLQNLNHLVEFTRLREFKTR